MSKQPNSSFEVSAIINYPRHIRPSREQPRFSESLQIEPKSTSNAPSSKAIPEQTTRPGGITLRSHLQSNPQFHPEVPSNNRLYLRLQSRRLSSPMLKTCNDHAFKVEIYV